LTTPPDPEAEPQTQPFVPSDDLPAPDVPAPPADPTPLDADSTIIIKRTQRVRRREAWVGWTQVLANIFVPATLLVAAWGFWADIQRQQRDAATRQVELFYSESLGNAQQVLFALWDDTDLSILANAQSRSFIDAFVTRTIEASDQTGREVSAAIVNLASYFDRVEDCIARSNCDEDEMLSQLGDYGRDFHCLYAGQIAMLRTDTLILSVGHGLERFADRAGGCSGE
jgi:hypothetical protein